MRTTGSERFVRDRSVATLNHNRRRGFLGSGTQGTESEPVESTLDTEAEAEAEAGAGAGAGGDLLDRSARDRRDRAETRMMTAVAQAQGTKTRPRRPLAELFHSAADSIPEPERGILRVRIFGTASTAGDAALVGLLEELTQTRTIYPGTELRMVYELPQIDCTTGKNGA